MENEEAQLRTGETVPMAMVSVVTITLEKLLSENPMALFELVTLARDPSHKLWGNSSEVLEKYSMTEGGRMHDLTRTVILAASEGDDLDMKLVNPLASVS